MIGVVHGRAGGRGKLVTVPRSVVVVRPAWGRRWFVSLLGWPSRGLGPIDVFAQDLPMVAVVVW